MEATHESIGLVVLTFGEMAMLSMPENINGIINYQMAVFVMFFTRICNFLFNHFLVIVYSLFLLV